MQYRQRSLILTYFNLFLCYVLSIIYVVCARHDYMTKLILDLLFLGE